MRGIPGIAQLMEEPRYARYISLADAGPIDLVAATTPMEGAELIRVASALAEAVAAMHRRLVIHRDITPGNVMIGRDAAPCLVDFALATTFAEIPAEFTHHGDIVGTLAYPAPEQIGRTGRPLDQRADLYALGATLYELPTAAPPFGFGDPLRLTHDHLARVPVPPTELNPALPRPLAEIILHLLEKEPDNRDQTAEGVLHDLTSTPSTGAVRVRVSDDGCGGADLGGGSGQIGVKDRIEALGGRFSVHTAPDAGTTAHAELPLASPRPGLQSRPGLCITGIGYDESEPGRRRLRLRQRTSVGKCMPRYEAQASAVVWGCPPEGKWGQP